MKCIKLKPTLVTGYTLTREDIEEVLERVEPIKLLRWEDEILLCFGPRMDGSKLGTIGDRDFDLIGTLDCPQDPEWILMWGYLVGTFTHTLAISSLRFEAPFAK